MTCEEDKLIAEVLGEAAPPGNCEEESAVAEDRGVLDSPLPMTEA
jgi:hypothetical protein